MNNADKHIVIIGGGAAGLSTAYHLGKLGCPNVLLLEQNQLTSGTSWHAAGIVGPLRASQNLTSLAKYALELFPQLEAETGQATGYKQTGGLWLTTEQPRLTELRRIAAMGEMNGLHGEFLTPGELKSRFDLINVDDLAGAMWLEQDGQVNPVDLCMALAKGARQNGVEIRENAGVMDIAVNDGAVTSVTLDSGECIECDVVVNCAGLWARHIGEMAGVNVPLHAVEHMYVVSEPIPEMPLPWPVIRDMEGALYIKEDAGKLVLGVFEPNAKLWDHQSVDRKSSYLVFEEDWDHIEPMMLAGINRIPRFETLGLTHFMTGPESFTPDTKQLMGVSAEVDNFFVAAGFNSLGIMSSPGVGKAMADWIVQGRSPVDLWEVDIQRFQAKDNELSFLQQRIPEAVSNQFDMHWPHKQYKTGRGRTKSIWHDQMAAMGAVFGGVSGWERPLWFATGDEPKNIAYSYDAQNWWPVAKRESEMLAKAGALFELSPFTKIIIEGIDALHALNHICTNQIDVPVGKVVYTLMLNDSGGIEAEVTVTRVDQNQFLLITASATRVKDFTWIKKHCCQFDVKISDQTDRYAVLGLMGPQSRTILKALHVANVENEEWKFGYSKMITINGASVGASRLSFVGELGWELMIENNDASDVLKAIVSTSQRYQVGMAGFLTMECCRLEKGYLHWGHDIGPEENPFQANLSFAVKMNKLNGFIGQEALSKLDQSPRGKQLTLFKAVGSDPLLLHDEPIFFHGKWVGRTTSGGMGMRVNHALCFGYVDVSAVKESIATNQPFDVKVQGDFHQIYVLEKPPYDPNGLKMRC